MIGSRRFFAFVAALVLHIGAVADAEPDPHEADAQRVLQAVRADDVAALRAIAEGDIDVWRVALVLCRHGEHDAAIALAGDVVPLAEQVRRWREAPLADGTLDALADADAAFAAKDLEGAAKRYGRVDSSDAFVAAWCGLRRAQSTMDDEALLDVLARVETSAAELGWVAGERAALEATAALARNVGAFEASLRAYERLAAFHEAREDRVPWAFAQMNQGSTLAMLGDYQGALRHYVLAAPPMRDLGPDRLELLYNTGLVHFQLGAYADAITTQEAARDLARASDEPVFAAECELRIAESMVRLGDLDAALELVRGATAGLERFEASVVQSEAMATLGLVQEKRGELDAALEAHRRAIELAKGSPSERFHVAVGRINVGMVLRKQGKLEEALVLHEQNLPVLESLRAERMVAVSHHELARIAIARADLGVAEAHVQKGLGIAEARDEAYLEVESLKLLIAIRRAEGKAADAVTVARRAVDSLQRIVRGLADTPGALARETYAEIYLAAAEAALDRGDAVALFEFVERSRAGALVEAMRSRGEVRRAVVPEALRKAEDDARTAQAIARTRYLGVRDTGNRRTIREARDLLRTFERRTMEVQKRIQRVRRAGVLYAEAVSVEDASAALEPDEALVLYAFLPTEVVALVLTKAEVRTVRLGAPDAIEAAVGATVFDDRRSEPSTASLEALLVTPLGLGDAKRVIVSPDSALFRVPFAVLLRDREVVHVASATVHVLSRADAALRGKGVLAVADPVYPGMPRLTETADEAKAIATVPLLREKATAEALREALAKRDRWRAVHLACHGLVDEREPMRSALALTGGPLTALEIAQMDVPADLVVLSACDTGRGKYFRGAGLLGLPSALRVAGASRVIVSLWKVDDKATRALMVRFYEHWNPETGGAGAAEALRDAQAFVRGHEKWRRPYYWGAWVLWGLPD